MEQGSLGSLLVNKKNMNLKIVHISFYFKLIDILFYFIYVLPFSSSPPLFKKKKKRRPTDVNSSEMWLEWLRGQGRLIRV